MWERRNWWVFMACLVLLVACEQTHTLKHTGRVIDRASRLPLAGVEVHLVVDGITHTAFTDNVGSYGFEIQVSASNASGLVVVLLDGYEPYDRNLSLSESLSSYEDIRLEVSTTNGILPLTVDVAEANPQPESDTLGLSDQVEESIPEIIVPAVTPDPMVVTFTIEVENANDDWRNAIEEPGLQLENGIPMYGLPDDERDYYYVFIDQTVYGAKFVLENYAVNLGGLGIYAPIYDASNNIAIESYRLFASTEVSEAGIHTLTLEEFGNESGDASKGKLDVGLYLILVHTLDGQNTDTPYSILYQHR